MTAVAIMPARRRIAIAIAIVIETAIAPGEAAGKHSRLFISIYSSLLCPVSNKHPYYI